MYTTMPSIIQPAAAAGHPLPVIVQRKRLPRRGSKRQQKFLLVVRLIVKSLASGSVGDRLLAAQIKTTVRAFTRLNRAGIKGCIPLQDKLEVELRQIVGDEAYAEASFMVDFYLAKRQLLRPC